MITTRIHTEHSVNYHQGRRYFIFAINSTTVVYRGVWNKHRKLYLCIVSGLTTRVLVTMLLVVPGIIEMMLSVNCVFTMPFTSTMLFKLPTGLQESIIVSKDHFEFISKMSLCRYGTLMNVQLNAVNESFEQNMQVEAPIKNICEKHIFYGILLGRT